MMRSRTKDPGSDKTLVDRWKLQRVEVHPNHCLWGTEIMFDRDYDSEPKDDIKLRIKYPHPHGIGTIELRSTEDVKALVEFMEKYQKKKQQKREAKWKKMRMRRGSGND